MFKGVSNPSFSLPRAKNQTYPKDRLVIVDFSYRIIQRGAPLTQREFGLLHSSQRSSLRRVLEKSITFSYCTDK